MDWRLIARAIDQDANKNGEMKVENRTEISRSNQEKKRWKTDEMFTVKRNQNIDNETPKIDEKMAEPPFSKPPIASINKKE